LRLLFSPLQVFKGRSIMLTTFSRSKDDSKLLVCAFLCSFAALFCVTSTVEAQASLSLSPAVIMAKGTFGQSLTQKLTINNQTQNIFHFEMMAEDIAVRDGKRVFLPAGDLENGIAATAIFSPKEVIAPPNTSASVDVTVTIPDKTPVRAIAAIFRAQSAVAPTAGSVGLVASMGTLLTFNLSPDVAITAEPVRVNPATDTTNLSFEQTLTNTGAEPVVPKGVAAILNDQNHLVGKTAFGAQRLLPGEKLVYRAEYSDQLKPGNYRVLCTFQYEEKTETQPADFTVK
jgi:hypothetical protein